MLILNSLCALIFVATIIAAALLPAMAIEPPLRPVAARSR
jgi:hypothetical protein